MRVEDFITQFRATVLDHAEPYFWADDEIVRHLNEAVQEACERAKLLEDRSTPAVCTVNIQPGISTYNLHPSVLEIKRLALRGIPLHETSIEEQDSTRPGWELRKGVPRNWIFEPTANLGAPRIRLVPVPVEAEAIELTVQRGALKPLDADNGAGRPEIPERFHTRLLDWMLYRAYSKPDADAFDPAKAAASLALFSQAFGDRPDANVQRKRRNRRMPVVRSSW